MTDDRIKEFEAAIAEAGEAAWYSFVSLAEVRATIAEVRRLRAAVDAARGYLRPLVEDTINYSYEGAVNDALRELDDARPL